MSTTQKQLAQSQYQALVRQQERYNQLLTSIGNTDIEKALKAKLRHEDSKMREEKQKLVKIRIKNQDRRRLETQVSHARQASQQNKKAVFNQGDDPASFLQPEESIEQAMRDSITKPPGNLDNNPMFEENKLTKTNDRVIDNKSQTTYLKSNELATQLNPQ